ncbi:MAG TPA: hypothetical protein VEB43_03960 [Anaeromyxobacter sp.]|nr:hypothetical protein [Anaeromyxobacter sp.]
MTLLRFARLAPAVALFLLTAMPAPTPALNRTIYTLLCSKEGLPLRTTVNDVEIDRSDTPTQSALAAPLNAWLKPGRNELRFLTPPGANVAKNASIFCKVIRGQRRNIVDTSDRSRADALVVLDWPASGKKAGPVHETLTLTLTEAEAPGCELWKRAERLTLDDPARAAS